MKKKHQKKTITIGNVIISLSDIGNKYHIFVNLGRKKKSKNIDDTWTIYDSILEKHQPYAHVWVDIQDEKLVGVEISADKKK